MRNKWYKIHNQSIDLESIIKVFDLPEADLSILAELPVGSSYSCLSGLEITRVRTPNKNVIWYEITQPTGEVSTMTNKSYLPSLKEHDKHLLEEMAVGESMIIDRIEYKRIQ